MISEYARCTYYNPDNNDPSGSYEGAFEKRLTPLNQSKYRSIAMPIRPIHEIRLVHYNREELRRQIFCYSRRHLWGLTRCSFWYFYAKYTNILKWLLLHKIWMWRKILWKILMIIKINQNVIFYIISQYFDQS